MTYLHSSVLTTNGSNSQGRKGYLVYGGDRSGDELLTENSSRSSLPTGQIYHLPGMCGTWDCPALGFDSASILLSVAGDAAAGCTAISGPLCGSAMAYIKAADYSVTTAAAAYAASQYASGDGSDLDLAIATADTAGGLIPGIGEGIGVGNLVWDLVDPLVPDERWWGPGGAR